MNKASHYKVIYLTGTPATGKSTLTANLLDAISPLQIFAYSKILAELVSHRGTSQISENSLREQSGRIVTPEDVNVVDSRLVEFVKKWRVKSHIIIDSHAVTKEDYGFRVTPFSLQLLAAINPTHIFCLFAEPSVIMDRVRTYSQGRPRISQFEADFHSNLQSSVALMYGLNLGIPIYFFDSNKPEQALVEEIVKRLI